MNGFSSSELLFYGGVAVMALAALGGVTATIVFTLSGRRLRRKLEQEFGKKRR